MARILVPYHLDEYLPGLDVVGEPDATITARLPGGDRWAAMAALYAPLVDAVATAERPVVLSGDCMTALGTVAGLQRRGLDPVIVWFDGHGDVQTLETSASGYLGGMPLRMLVGYRPELLADRIGLRPVKEDAVTLVDARDLDPPEAAYLAGSAIHRVSVDALDAASVPQRPVYLHVDLDVIDPGELPGLRFPAPHGPSLAAVAAALGRLLDTGRVAAVGLACTWHPDHGAANAVAPELEAVLRRW